MSIEINRLSDALGAEITGLNLSEAPDEADVPATTQAFLDHHLLCFRGEPLELQAFARVARYFGEPQMQLLRDQRVEAVPVVSVLDSTPGAHPRGH